MSRCAACGPPLCRPARARSKAQQAGRSEAQRQGAAAGRGRAQQQGAAGRTAQLAEDVLVEVLLDDAIEVALVQPLHLGVGVGDEERAVARAPRHEERDLAEAVALKVLDAHLRRLSSGC